MKKAFLFTGILFCCYCASAQVTTNTFPTTGNVGIGTLTPSSLLHLQSTSVPLITLTNTGIIAWKLGNFDQSTDNGFTIGFNATKMLYIGSSGKIGIGTTSPTNLLHVMGGIGGNDILQLNNTDATDGRTAILFNSGKGQAWEFGENIAGSTGLFGLRDMTSSGFPIRLAVNTSGYLGVGTSAPTNPLTVVGNNNGTSTANTATFSSNYGSASSIGNQVNITNLQTSWGLLVGFDGSGVPASLYHGPNAGYLINVQNAPLYFGTNNAENMMITPAGNVCIGTTNPHGYLLAVNGSAIATSVTVKLNANWPDYVFKADYQLPSLQEVKSYIDQNHHLPEMPSATEVEKDGLNLGETNKILTKKVEELTLYLIAKDAELKRQESELNGQKEINRILDQRLKKLEDEIETSLKQNGIK